LLAVPAAGCQTAGFTEKDRAAIAANSDAWFNAAGAHKPEVAAALYTEDAVLMAPELPEIRGRQAIADFLSHLPRIEKFTWERHEVVGGNDLAYSWGAYTMVSYAPQARHPITEKGKYLEIWRKQPDGSWKISRDIYNSDAPH